MSDEHSAEKDAGRKPRLLDLFCEPVNAEKGAAVLHFPTPAERCWECGRKATRIAPTAAPEDVAPPLGCDECYPDWPALTRVTPPGGPDA